MAPFFDRPASLLLTECLPGWAVEFGKSSAVAGGSFGSGGSTAAAGVDGGMAGARPGERRILERPAMRP